MLFYISLFYIPHVAVTRFFARVRMLNERYQKDLLCILPSNIFVQRQ